VGRHLRHHRGCGARLRRCCAPLLWAQGQVTSPLRSPTPRRRPRCCPSAPAAAPSRAPPGTRRLRPPPRLAGRVPRCGGAASVVVFLDPRLALPWPCRRQCPAGSSPPTRQPVMKKREQHRVVVIRGLRKRRAQALVGISNSSSESESMDSSLESESMVAWGLRKRLWIGSRRSRAGGCACRRARRRGGEEQGA
jgi:hypothetical protein